MKKLRGFPLQFGESAPEDLRVRDPALFRSAGHRRDFLFLFRVKPLIMMTFEPNHNFDAEDFSGDYDHKSIVADAEKAFLKLLDPEYNVVKFKSYPKGADGLYRSDFDRYDYAICEAISFSTTYGRFRGSRDAASGFITNDSDSIFIEGGIVKLFVSGVDFPAEPLRDEPNASLHNNQKGKT